MDLGESCYHAVCDAPDAGAAVQSLSDPHLRALIGYCGRDCDENGVTGEILGVALLVAAWRFMANKRKES